MQEGLISARESLKKRKLQNWLKSINSSFRICFDRLSDIVSRATVAKPLNSSLARTTQLRLPEREAGNYLTGFFPAFVL
jgi:hypothetical protein